MGFLKQLFAPSGAVVPKTSPLQHIHDMMASREVKIGYIAPSVKPYDHGLSPSGTLEIKFKPHTPCPGFDGGSGTIELNYHLPSGIQESYHENPGVRYDGARRRAFLPNTPQGRCLLTRFKYAFAHGHMFRVGRSIAFRKDNQTTWATIPNKTTLSGGEFGFPDKTYLAKAHAALDQLGIPDADDCLDTAASQSNNSHPALSAQQGAAAAAAAADNQTQPAKRTYPFHVTERTIRYDAPQSLSLSDADIAAALEPYKQPAAGAKTSAAPVPAAAPASLGSGSGSPTAAFATPVIAMLPPALAPPSPSHKKGTIANLQPAQMITATDLAPAGGTAAPVSANPSGCHDPDCAICLDPLSGKDAAAGDCVQLKLCQHGFHRSCITDCLRQAPNCPVCRQAVGIPQGKSPSGTMKISVNKKSKCPGFPGSPGVISILYDIPSGTQARYHENPGASYDGTTRIAYLPDTVGGRRLLYRLVYAWKRGLIFRIGTSLTSGLSGQVTWTSVHHKTSLHGGPHGFPDDNYLANCNASLDALNVPDAYGCVLTSLD